MGEMNGWNEGLKRMRNYKIDEKFIRVDQFDETHHFDEHLLLKEISPLLTI